jgi:hypothetical protein
MADLVQGYYATLQRNDGAMLAPFAPQCRLVSNGVTIVDGTDKATGCTQLFERGIFRPVEHVRARRIRAVDEARGLVVASAMLDRPAASVDFRGADGRTRSVDIRYPYTQGVVDVFRIENGRIARVEGVSAFMPYGMPPAWE